MPFRINRIRAAKRTGQTRRDPWLDAWRGLALLFMIAFHAWYLLRQWYGYRFWGSESELVGWIGGAAAVSFFLVSGVTTGLTFDRLRAAAVPPVSILAKFVRRSVRIWLAALVITVVTFLVVPAETVWFGTLHFLAVGNLILSASLLLFPGRRQILPPLAVMILASSYWIKVPTAPSLDYYPLLPWMAALFCGAWLGTNRGLTLAIPFPRKMAVLAWLGRNSLIIYLGHIPALMGLIEIGRRWF